MRNAIIHRYFDINWEFVWEVVSKDAADLIATLEKIVPAEDASGGGS